MIDSASSSNESGACILLMESAEELESGMIRPVEKVVVSSLSAKVSVVDDVATRRRQQY